MEVVCIGCVVFRDRSRSFPSRWISVQVENFSSMLIRLPLVYCFLWPLIASSRSFASFQVLCRTVTDACDSLPQLLISSV